MVITQEKKDYIKANYATKTTAEIAKELGVSTNAVAYHLSKMKLVKNKVWQPKEVWKLRNMVERGLNVADIAKELGRSEQSVYSQIFNMRKEAEVIPVVRKVRIRLTREQQKAIVKIFDHTMKIFELKNPKAKAFFVNQLKDRSERKHKPKKD